VPGEGAGAGGEVVGGVAWGGELDGGDGAVGAHREDEGDGDVVVLGRAGPRCCRGIEGHGGRHGLRAGSRRAEGKAEAEREREAGG